MRRICVTGIGVHCHEASDVPALWRRLVAGEAGLKEEAPFDLGAFRCRRNVIADPAEARRTLRERRPDLAQALSPSAPRSLAAGLLAAHEALATAGLPSRAAAEIALVLGSTSGGAFDAFQEGRVPEEHAAEACPHANLAAIARAFGLTGPTAQIGNACTSSAAAIVHAAGMILSGRVDVALCGGVDHARRADFAGFNALRAMSGDCCRSFDVDRDGMIIGDGAALLVLEEETRALARGAQPLAYLDGFGLSADAFHATRARPDGLARAVGHALRMAESGPEAIGYVNCHGTGTPANDATEARALEAHFPEGARPVLSSTKTVTGHLLGTAAALEAAITIMILRRGLVPEMPNSRVADPEIAFPLALGRPVDLAGAGAALSTTLGFGGSNACLAFSLPAPAAGSFPDRAERAS